MDNSVLKTIWDGLDWSVLTDGLFNIIPAVICVTFHEFCHGLAAYAMGDDTAKKAGRLTLNPLRSLDMSGLVMMAAFHIGWAKPVPVNMHKFKNPKRGMALTALAGPCSNLLLTVFALLLYGLLFIPLSGRQAGELILETLVRTAILSTSLGVFNLLPVPPLDGSKVVFSLMNNRAYETLMRYERYGFLALIALSVTGVITDPLSRMTEAVFSRCFAVAEWSYELAKEFLK